MGTSPLLLVLGVCLLRHHKRLFSKTEKALPSQKFRAFFVSVDNIAITRAFSKYHGIAEAT